MSITPILIIGAQKSGTSYLFRLLADDPVIARATSKGPNIFCKPANDTASFLSHFNLEPQHRFALDGSDPYMHVAGTAERVERRLGTDMPVIAVLRDPVERAVSAYLHEVKHGRELRTPGEVFDLPTGNLADIVDAEAVAIDRAWRRGDLQPHNPPEQRYCDSMFQFRFVGNSWYAHQLGPWLRLFPNLRFVEFADLRARPVEVTARLRRWIGLDTSRTIESSQPQNETRLNPWKALRENRTLHHDYQRPGLVAVWARQRALFRELQGEKPPLPPTLANALRDEFTEFRKKEAARWI